MSEELEMSEETSDEIDRLIAPNINNDLPEKKKDDDILNKLSSDVSNINIKLANLQVNNKDEQKNEKLNEVEKPVIKSEKKDSKPITKITQINEVQLKQDILRDIETKQLLASLAGVEDPNEINIADCREKIANKIEYVFKNHPEIEALIKPQFDAGGVLKCDDYKLASLMKAINKSLELKSNKNVKKNVDVAVESADNSERNKSIKKRYANYESDEKRSQMYQYLATEKDTELNNPDYGRVISSVQAEDVHFWQ